MRNAQQVFVLVLAMAMGAIGTAARADDTATTSGRARIELGAGATTWVADGVNGAFAAMFALPVGGTEKVAGERIDFFLGAATVSSDSTGLGLFADAGKRGSNTRYGLIVFRSEGWHLGAHMRTVVANW